MLWPYQYFYTDALESFTILLKILPPSTNGFGMKAIFDLLTFMTNKSLTDSLTGL